MNRHDRRRKAAMEQHNGFFESYVKHLPEVGFEALSKPGVSHLVLFHDSWCRIYDGDDCNCDPDVKLYQEPLRA